MNKYRIANEWVNAHGPKGGSFQDVTYPTDQIDDIETNRNTISGLREQAIAEMLKRDPSGRSLDSLYQPENNDLPLHGIGRGRGNEVDDLEALLKTGNDHSVSTNDAELLWKKTEPAVDKVADEMNLMRR